jgi:protein TonB
LEEIAMLAYAAHRRRIAQRHSAPHLMLAIIAGHIALIAVVMSARMDLPPRIDDRPIIVDPIALPEPPPPNPAEPKAQPKPSPTITRTPAIVPIPQPRLDQLDPTPIPTPSFPAVRPTPNPEPRISPVPAPVRVGPRFATPAHAVRPPYPASKIASDEEAVLRLKLAIDPRGRVVAVEPVGRADPAFLAAARRHLLAHWRYKPATEGGRAIASSTVITLRFELES